MTAAAPQEIRTIATPPGLVIDLLQRSNSGPQFLEPTDLYTGPMKTGFNINDLVGELCELGILKEANNAFELQHYSVVRILDELAVAGALGALCAYQCTLLPSPPDYTRLQAINDAIKLLDHSDSSNVLHGAYLDYQFHLEMIRLPGNQPAIAAYAATIKPALWLNGSAFYTVEDALSSIWEHDRMIAILKSGDSLRARDTAAYHIENAIDHIRKVAQSQRQSAQSAA